MIEERTLRLFGVPESTVRERLADVVSCDGLSVALSCEDEDIHLHLTAQTSDILEWAIQEISVRLGAFLYSLDGKSLEAQTVALLTEKHKTVAVAESCTGGMIAARLTDVPGCSAVFGTGIVSYSRDCKQQLLGVSLQTLESHGAVSAQTAREMADGVRRKAGADIGIATTGEAGPQAAEDKPVGTVFVALADAKRTWVKELHLDAERLDREAIRRVAASHALELARRYLQAHPTVMAGGERHTDYAQRQRNAALPDTRVKRLAAVLPWRGDRKTRLLKAVAWLSVLAVLVVGVVTIYNHILAPTSNRELQGDLADIYWDSTSDLTVDAPEDDTYPAGMMSQFRGLYDINADVAGWVRIPDTTINYPVMNYADGYYNNHSFNDQFSIYGQPYFYKENGRDTLQMDRVLAVYGNNTRDEQMFSALASYRRIAFLRENPIIEMNTLYDTARWEIFAVAVVDERTRASEFEYLRRDFDDEAAFEQYLSQLQRHSLLNSDAALTAEDSLLLLVTNVEREYGFTGARLVVAARRMTDTEPTLSYSLNNAPIWPLAYQKLTTTRPTTTSTTQTTTTTSATDASSSTTVESTTSSTTSTESVDQSTTTVSVDGGTTTTTIPSNAPAPDDEESSDVPVLGEPEEESSSADEPTDPESEGSGDEDDTSEETVSDSSLTETNDTESYHYDHLGN